MLWRIPKGAGRRFFILGENSAIAPDQSDYPHLVSVRIEWGKSQVCSRQMVLVELRRFLMQLFAKMFFPAGS